MTIFRNKGSTSRYVTNNDSSVFRSLELEARCNSGFFDCTIENVTNLLKIKVLGVSPVRAKPRFDTRQQ